MTSLSGKSIIITGVATGNIGDAAAMLAVERGARLTIADWNEEGGREVCERAKALGAEVQFIRTDISSSDNVQAMVAAAVSAYGRLDGAFNCAAITSANIVFSEMPDDEYKRRVGINLTGTFLCTKYEIRAMIKTGGGSIVNTSSALALVTIHNHAEYASAKAGILALTRAAARDHGHQGIRVNTIMPGPITTRTHLEGAARTPGLKEKLLDPLPLGRAGTPRELAAGALWLLSDDSSYVTGVTLPVDGGMTIL